MSSIIKVKKIFISLFCILLCTQLVQSKITIFTIGDSTMADRSASDSEQGWGTFFSKFVNLSEVNVSNHAINGYSAQGFINNGKWSVVLNSLREGDFVIIQFGHNDAKEDADANKTAYQANLTKIVEETRAKKAIPILMTSIVRRNFDNVGNISNTHGNYADVVRSLAQQLDVALVDMELLSAQLENIAGIVNSRKLHEFYPGKEIDNTHLCKYGAYVMARLAADGIRDQNINIPLNEQPEKMAEAEENTIALGLKLLSLNVQDAKTALADLSTATGKVEFQTIIDEVEEKIANKSYKTLTELDAGARKLREAELAFKWTQTPPFNATFAVGNPGMEEGAIWDIVNNSLMPMSWTMDASIVGKDVQLKTGNVSEGYYRFYIWGNEGSDIDVYQDLTLPTGKYVLKADLRPYVNKETFLYVKNNDHVEEVQSRGSWSSTWGTTELHFTVTENNATVRIGVMSALAVMIDNVQLMKVEDIQSAGIIDNKQKKIYAEPCAGGIIIRGVNERFRLNLYTVVGQLIKTFDLVSEDTIPLSV